MVTENDLNEFIKIYEEKFNKKISAEAAQEQAVKLLRLIQIAIDGGEQINNYEPIKKIF